jgi:hypothetical protein
MRYHIMVCTSKHAQILNEIAQLSWEFLERNNYAVDDGLCPDLKTGAITLLLTDLSFKLPPEFVKPNPQCKILPGLSGNIQLKNFEIELKIQNNSWTQTGLWLPAGAKGVIKCDNFLPDIHVQIGSHTESLVNCTPPWKRWPNVISNLILTESPPTIISPFGGIIYFFLGMLAEENSSKLSFKFEGFSQYPRIKFDDDSIWQQTKDIEVPWGELDIGSVIFTLPTEYLKKINQVDEIQKTFFIIVNEISQFMASPPERTFRIVFDVQLASPLPNPCYPLVLLIEDIEGILINRGQPNHSLYTAIIYMAIILIPEECIYSVTEMALGNVCAASIFQKLFQEFDPIQFLEGNAPTLFQELWEIHTKFDLGLLPKVLEKFQNSPHETSGIPEDMWISFAHQVCTIGERNFIKFLDRAKPHSSPYFKLPL